MVLFPEIMNRSIIAIFVSAIAAIPANAVVFFDDFSSGSVSNASSGYIGGWYGSLFGFGQWYGPSQELNTTIEIDGGSLTVSTDSPFRSAVMLFEPSDFSDGAGQYLVTLTVSGYTSGAGNGLVRVWSGSGYDLTGQTGNAVFVRPEVGDFTVFGDSETVSVSSLGSLEIDTTGTHTLQINYDGTSAVGIFLGVTTVESPQPTIEYGSISLALIPEPSTSVLGLVSVSMLLMQRRR